MKLDNEAGVKHKGAAKTARIPIKIVPLDEKLKKPEWIRAKLPTGQRFHEIKQILRDQKTAYRVRRSHLPEYRRVLQQGYGHFHDHG